MTAALVVSSTPWPHFTPGQDPVPILQEAGWAPGPVWTGGKSRPHRDSILDRPARSQSLYRLSYPAQTCRGLVGSDERRSSLMRPKCRWGLILKYISMNCDGRKWTEFMWFWRETSGWNLRRWWDFVFRNLWVISWLAERALFSEERICSVASGSYPRNCNLCNL